MGLLRERRVESGFGPGKIQRAREPGGFASPVFAIHHRILPLDGERPDVTLVIQGANDPRVLQVESDELVAKIQANEVPVEYIVFPDEGHGFRKKGNRDYDRVAKFAFLEAYLKQE